METVHSKFFFVMPPGFEQVAFYEIARQLQIKNIEIPPIEFFTGGLEMDLPLEIGLALNSLLRIPTRILLRIATQEIFSIKEYIHFIKEQGWKNFPHIGKVYVSSRSSHLKIKGNLSEIFEKTLQLSPKRNFSGATDVYIRFFRDECTISVDTSGDDLYQRGYDKWVGEAPIRDNMAAAFLQMALRGVEDLSQWEILDPMMGSGTFLIEGFYTHKNYSREFAFQKWNKAFANQGLISDLGHFPENSNQPQLRGFDRDAKMVESAARNLKQLNIPDRGLQQEDLLQTSRAYPCDRRRLVIVNPPYGKRIKISERDLFLKIMDKVDLKFAPDRLAMIVPPSLDLSHDNYESIKIMPFSNNGIPVKFMLFVKRGLWKAGE